MSTLITVLWEQQQVKSLADAEEHGDDCEDILKKGSSSLVVSKIGGRKLIKLLLFFALLTSRVKEKNRRSVWFAGGNGCSEEVVDKR